MARVILVLFILAWMGWSLYATVALIQLRRLVAGFKEPELWLPRRERRAHARKLLRREDEEYTQHAIDLLMQQGKVV